jgi:RNA polymerase sigma factor (sigma-70 family)
MFVKDPSNGGQPTAPLRRIFVVETALGSVAESTVEARLYEQHADLIYRYCLRTLGSREDAEDATQTTFFQAVRAMRRGVVPAFEQAWLLTIAKNECRSRHRANGRRRQLELVRDPQAIAEVAEAPNGSDGTLIGVQEALGRLPEMQRRALLLREWQGRSYAEIAAELGVTRPSVEALLFRARRGLARELGEETKSRRHALDVASLLGALKSALGGGGAG